MSGVCLHQVHLKWLQITRPTLSHLTLAARLRSQSFARTPVRRSPRINTINQRLGCGAAQPTIKTTTALAAAFPDRLGGEALFISQNVRRAGLPCAYNSFASLVAAPPAQSWAVGQ